MNMLRVSSALPSSGRFLLLLVFAGIALSACRDGHNGLITVQQLPHVDSVSIVVTPQHATPTDTLTFRAMFVGRTRRPLFFRWTFGAAYHTIEGLDLDSVRYKFDSYRPVEVRLEISDPDDPAFHLVTTLTTSRQPVSGELTFDSLPNLRRCTIELTTLNYYTTDAGKKRTDSIPIVFRSVDLGDWIDQMYTYYSSGWYQPYGGPPVRDSTWAYALFDKATNRFSSVKIGAGWANSTSDPSKYIYVKQWIDVMDVPIVSVTADTVIGMISGEAVRSHVTDLADNPSSVHWGNGGLYAWTLDSIGWHSTQVTPTLRVIFTKY